MRKRKRKIKEEVFSPSLLHIFFHFQKQAKILNKMNKKKKEVLEKGRGRVLLFSFLLFSVLYHLYDVSFYFLSFFLFYITNLIAFFFFLSSATFLLSFFFSFSSFPLSFLFYITNMMFTSSDIFLLCFLQLLDIFFSLFLLEEDFYIPFF